MISAGELKNRIRFEKRSLSGNGFGGFVETWAELCTVFGRYVPLRGKEREAQQQVNPEITVRIHVRYRTDITTDRRAYYNGKYHNILEVIDVDNTHTELMLMCQVLHSNQ